MRKTALKWAAVLLAVVMAGWRDFIEITIFIGILSLVIVYAWSRGVFSWKRKQVNP